jgi:arginyl-tRNA synthetase
LVFFVYERLMTNPFALIESLVSQTTDALIAEGVLPADCPRQAIAVEPPRDATHGDIATNAAMVLCKAAGMKPRDLAERYAAALQAHALVASAELAGPGFINLRMQPECWTHELLSMIEQQAAYGDSVSGAGRKVNVEYVSANPTGPLHVGHARGAVFGDALASLLEKAGYEVTREYYINDAGGQIDVLARSAYLRYREACGEAIEIPAGLYPGDYLVPVGQALKAEHGEALLSAEESEWLPKLRRFAVAQMMDLIRDDLKGLGIEQEVFTSELSLHESGAIEKAIDVLRGKGVVGRGVLEPPKGKLPDDWEAREQLLFFSSQFGDDSDRALQKPDDSYTYFAADLALSEHKIARGFDELVYIFGADHGGYKKRMEASVKALSDGKVACVIRLCQIVHLMRGGEPVKMSKRAGTFETVRDLLDALGDDAAGILRFIMLTRKNDAEMEFDLEKVKEQSKDNPVFYVQYAHARAKSVLRLAGEQMPECVAASEKATQDQLALLNSDAELALMKLLAGYPRMIEAAARSSEPHRVAFYLQEVAAAFHGLWQLGSQSLDLRFVVEGNAELTVARLALARAVAAVVASGLNVLGVQAKDSL